MNLFCLFVFKAGYLSGVANKGAKTGCFAFASLEMDAAAYFKVVLNSLSSSVSKMIGM